jgi:hypothetical protein
MRLRLPQHQKLEREKMREDDKREDNFRATQLRERKRWFVSKIPRGDTNGVGEDEVTVTSGQHTQAVNTENT